MITNLLRVFSKGTNCLILQLLPFFKPIIMVNAVVITGVSLEPPRWSSA